MTEDRTRLEVSRELAAEPVSAALLLTSATALEWWPGLRVDRREVGGTLAATVATGRTAEAVDIQALPPHRTPTAFVAGFRVTGGSYGTTDGAVTLIRRADGTHATLALEGPRADLEPAARQFLRRLAKAAETRSTAA